MTLTTPALNFMHAEPRVFYLIPPSRAGVVRATWLWEEHVHKMYCTGWEMGEERVMGSMDLEYGFGWEIEGDWYVLFVYLSGFRYVGIARVCRIEQAIKWVGTYLERACAT